MLYAKIAVGLAVRGPFDYSVPDALASRIAPGARAWVSFGTRRVVGYVVGLSRRSSFKKLKPLLELIDTVPVLDENLLTFTRELAGYYYCSWGEAIETALPEELRRGKKINDASLPGAGAGPLSRGEGQIELIHDLAGEARWDNYISAIRKNRDSGLSSIILLPDIGRALKARKMIKERSGAEPVLIYRKMPRELEEWLKLRSAEPNIAVGMRSAVFAPLRNPGLIIVDNEDDPAYKQDQMPHYHARQAAFLRAKLSRARVILGSRSPSLESIYLSRKSKAAYTLIPRKTKFPEVKVIDTRHLSFQERKRKALFSNQLEEALYSLLNVKGKALLLINRRGFATSCACLTCGKPLKCPRCNINLVYHFKEDRLSCHYCNFKMQVPKICPECNAGYIKFSGAGTEKIESELSRVFPQARIRIFDDADPGAQEADILIATGGVTRREGLNFDLVALLGIDNALNRPDFRATEKVSALLSGLLSLTSGKIFIQTSSPGHHCFQALLKQDPDYFYTEELKQRMQLAFPPYQHLAMLFLRGKHEDKVKEGAEALFGKLKQAAADKGVEVVAVNPCSPLKKRGNYYWQVLLRSRSVARIGVFLKNNLKDFRHSGIIVTVDVDPV